MRRHERKHMQDATGSSAPGILGRAWRLGRKAAAAALLQVLVLFQIANLVFMPLPLRAETSGATAPEVTKFEPVDTTDLVNLTTGDFTYNIPVINVPGPEGGYPMALSYHSGPRMGEEASWVGLGWDLQPGAIARGVRNYPDDFSGETITRNVSSNVYDTDAIGVGFSVGFVNATVGISYTSYKGYGGYVSLGIGIDDTPASASVTLSYAPGGHWSASVGLDYTVCAGLSVGASLSSAGVVGVSAQLHETEQKEGADGQQTTVRTGNAVGVTANVDNHGVTTAVSATFSQGVDMAQKNSGASTGIGLSPATTASVSSYSGGGVHESSFTVPFFFGSYSHSEYWIDKTETEVAYGYFYHYLPPPSDTTSDAYKNRVNEWSMESDPNVVGQDSPQHALAQGLNYSPSYDGYQVMGQGTGGNIRPTRLIERVFHPRRVTDQWYEANNWPWAAGQPGEIPQFVFENDNSEQIPQGDSYLGLAARDQNADGSLSASSALYTDVTPVMNSTTPVNSQSFPSASGTPSLFMGKSFRPGGGARRIAVHYGGIYDGAPTSTTPGPGMRFLGFDVTETDGKVYNYGEPVYQWWSTNASANVPVVQGEYLTNTTRIATPYSYAWYLTSLKYPDYYDADGDGKLSDADKGGWVRFSYVIGSNDYRWHTSSDGQLNDGPLNIEDKVGKDKAGQMYSMEYGSKQIKYLQQVETASHIAIFAISPRADGKEVFNGGGGRSTSIVITPPTDGSGLYDIAYSQTDQGDTYPSFSFPGMTSQMIKSWTQVTSNSTAFTCGAEPCTDTNFLKSGHDEAVLTKDCWVTLNGIPFRPIKLTRDYNQDSACTMRDPSACNGEPVYTADVATTSYTYHMTVQVNLPGASGNVAGDFRNPSSTNQFWAQSIPNAPFAFGGLQQQWAQMLATASSNHGVVSLGSMGMQKLDDIYLLEKSTGNLVKQVHFTYGYSLCPGTPNSFDQVLPQTDSHGVTTNVNVNPTHGKLTLVAVQVFGEGGMPASNAGASAFNMAGLPPYRFTYAASLNRAWRNKYQYDRWGFFKSDGSPWNHRDANPNDQAAWNLTQITLPTGGNLQIEYEPKDYSRVQDRFPLNPSANQGQVAHYKLDINQWLTAMGKDSTGASLTPWPQTKTQWAQFYAKVGSTPIQTYPAAGYAAESVPAVSTTLNLSQNPQAPIKSAPNPRDLATFLANTSPAYQTLMASAQTAMGAIQSPGTLAMTKTGLVKAQTTGTVALSDQRSPLNTFVASGSSQVDSGSLQGMVQFTFDYWTLGSGLFRRLQPHTSLNYLTPDDILGMGDNQRLDCKVESAIVLMKNLSNNRAQFMVVDPDFQWPTEAPNEVYVTWTPPSNKIGGGARVKRVVSYDGRRSYSTNYSYMDLVNGTWASSGVEAVEPMPFGYSAADDRVIKTEQGGWNNETPGGIYYGRVTVRHSWSDVSQPAGIGGTTIPMGESVFRFITPADLPHRQKVVEDVRPAAASGVSTNNQNGIRLTEVFNTGAWWGQPLWKEDRDANGRVIARTEHQYRQLRGYLQDFPQALSGPVGTDADWEAAAGAPRPDMSYAWADTTLPTVVAWKGATPSTVAQKIGKDFSDTSSITQSQSYLNASVEVTMWQAYQPSRVLFPTNWASSVNVVREASLPPVSYQTTTYGDNLLAGNPKPAPIKVEQTDLWDSLTGTSLETRSKGRALNGSSGDEWIITRTWPAYWVYPGMQTKNMLSQTAQTTTLRQLASGATVFLNSKVNQWWQPNLGDATSWDRWMQGGEFGWNGQGANPPAFPDFFWNPATAKDGVGLEQVTTAGSTFKSQGWIFAGSVTAYDAFGRALEALDADGNFGSSRYGYPYSSPASNPDGSINYNDPAQAQNALPAGLLPVAKFANARTAETLYLNFEGTSTNAANADSANLVGKSVNFSDDPLVRLRNAYSGERAWDSSKQGNLTIKIPAGSTPTGGASSTHEVRYFVLAAPFNGSATQGSAIAAASVSSMPAGGKVLQVVPAEAVPDIAKQWWMIRLQVPSSPATGTPVQLGITGLIDDVSAFPRRRNTAPASVSHFAYDRVLGLVTSITGANGRTTRYRYDLLGRLMTVYDAYGKPSAATKYQQVVAIAPSN